MLPLDTYVTELRVLIRFANVVGSSVQINPPKHVLNFAESSVTKNPDGGPQDF